MVSGVLVLAVGARPSAEAPYPTIGVPDAHVGTTYGFDGLLCVGSQVATTTVEDVRVREADGGTTRVVRPPEGPTTIGFPVDPDAGAPAAGLEVPAGPLDCSLRVLVTPDEQGRVRAGEVELVLAYGPGGVLSRTVVLRPDVDLSVTRTGPDPRARR